MTQLKIAVCFLVLETYTFILHNNFSGSAELNHKHFSPFLQGGKPRILDELIIIFLFSWY